MTTKIETKQLRTERKATANNSIAKAGVSCFADTFVQGGSSVLKMKFSSKTPRYRNLIKTLVQTLIEFLE